MAVVLSINSSRVKIYSMRYLGIDYGSKRVGVAVSDETGEFALPLVVLPNTPKFLSEIKKIITEKKVGAVVLGESKNFKGEDNAIMFDIRKLKEELEQKTGLSVHLEAEFLTSAEAQRMNTCEPEQSRKSGVRMRRPKVDNDMLDASAAAIILQSFLNHESKISFDDFKKVEITVGKILSAEKIPNTDKLLKLSVDFGIKI